MRVHAAGRHQAHEVAGAAAAVAGVRSGSCSAGARSISPLAIAALMRGRSCITRRPAPMLRCPTSELPICPGGRPTSLPEVRRKRVRTGRPQPVETRRAGLADGVVGRLLAPAPAVEHDQHHGTTLLHPYVLCPSSAMVNGRPPATIERRFADGCVGLQPHRQPQPERVIKAQAASGSVLFLSHRCDFCSRSIGCAWRRQSFRPPDVINSNRCHFWSGG